ncbi:Ras-Specific Guanine Nucleotide-Releasing Factor 2 [Manis pentadactyla]|nr:Ras-Specific Guanine Nucleotide-Releasing Factor 2 [Manis pentadactyla]
MVKPLAQAADYIGVPSEEELNNKLRSSERHERKPEAPAQRAGTGRGSPPSAADTQPLQPFVNPRLEIRQRGAPPKRNFNEKESQWIVVLEKLLR